MKPLPMVAGIVVVAIVLAGFAVFLLTSGSDGPDEEAMTADRPGAGGQGPAPASSPVTEARTAAATPAEQQEQAAGTGQGIISAGPGGGVARDAGLGPGPAQGGLPQELQDQEGLPILPWQADDLTDLEQSATESLVAIEGAAPRVAWALVDSDWLADEMTLTESLALTLIQELAETEPALAGQVADLPWLADDLAEEQARALAAIRDLAATGPETLAAALLAPWLEDGVSEEDQITLDILEDIVGEDPALARRMAESPDLDDGISGAELAAFTGSDNYYLERIERDHPDLAEVVKGYAWLSPSASRTGRFRGPEMLASPLLDDGLTNYDRRVLNLLDDMASRDEVVARQVAGWPWLADGITRTEAHTLSYLESLDLDLLRKMVRFPWLADNQVTDSEEWAHVPSLEPVPVCGYRVQPGTGGDGGLAGGPALVPGRHKRW